MEKLKQILEQDNKNNESVKPYCLRGENIRYARLSFDDKGKLFS